MSSALETAKAEAPQQDRQPGGLEQHYLAQAPILCEDGQAGPLAALQRDICVPAFLGAQRLSHINLWMNAGEARSSLHYDPFHNLLCLVGGAKAVALASPAATRALCPRPLWGESGNHAGADLSTPQPEDPAIGTPCSGSAEAGPSSEAFAKRTGGEAVLTAQLRPGDALFIPEGWWHSVCSAPASAAVNLWWRSRFGAALGPPHMATYQLRRCAQELADAERAALLRRDLLCAREERAVALLALAARLNASATRVLAALSPEAVRRVLGALAARFPRSTATLLCGALPAAAAELLITRLEAADAELAAAGRASEVPGLYERLYATVDEPSQAMACLLRGKEAFSAAALQAALRCVLNLDDLEAAQGALSGKDSALNNDTPNPVIIPPSFQDIMSPTARAAAVSAAASASGHSGGLTATQSLPPLKQGTQDGIRAFSPRPQGQPRPPAGPSAPSTPVTSPPGEEWRKVKQARP
ncbi:hypothetical protein WJX81_004106 [Elliptochloris bilobata]|uniref:JmjC domain-containing protein n=1 Tax=Elliptochloris bilobata TaxID=381761 RepID=A0AAW1RCI5_9CHLO